MFVLLGLLGFHFFGDCCSVVFGCECRVVHVWIRFVIGWWWECEWFWCGCGMTLPILHLFDCHPTWNKVDIWWKWYMLWIQLFFGYKIHYMNFFFGVMIWCYFWVKVKDRFMACVENRKTSSENDNRIWYLITTHSNASSMAIWLLNLL